MVGTVVGIEDGMLEEVANGLAEVEGLKIGSRIRLEPILLTTGFSVQRGKRLQNYTISLFSPLANYLCLR